jgi:hypothetical protein
MCGNRLGRVHPLGNSLLGETLASMQPAKKERVPCESYRDPLS